MLGVACDRDDRRRKNYACVKLRIPSTLPFLREFVLNCHHGTSVAQVRSGTLPTWKRDQGSLALEVSKRFTSTSW